MSQSGPFVSEQLTFETTKISSLSLQLSVSDGWPVKLGDGTFGVVYQAFDPHNFERYAVKLLYDNLATHPVELRRLDTTHFDKILIIALDSLNLSSQERQKIEDGVKNGSHDTSEIITRLEHTGISDWKKVIDALQKEARSTAVERFLSEMKVSLQVRLSLQQRGLQAPKLEGLVEIKGGTETFHSSQAFISLSNQKYFKDQRTQVSNYALVMDLYQFTLKELLEKGPKRQLYQIRPAVLAEVFAGNAPQELTDHAPNAEKLQGSIQNIPIAQLPGDNDVERMQIRQRLVDNIEELFGYGLLRSMSIRDRVRTALPYLEGITKGLINLHSVDEPKNGGPLFHHDIKPANLFVNAEDQKSLDCALGDLGFVSSIRQAAGTQAPQQDELPLGSLHYRSPEQKEFFDVATVEVRHDGTAANLIVRDPKFRGSFIGKDDVVIFSKDHDRNQYIIRDTQPSGSATIVVISASPDVARNGDYTQVIFYKRQGHRTDLFGVGAIAYDMITCGESPERFYESIRRFEYSDEPNHRSDAGNVETLLEKYSRVSQGRAYADDPSLVQIFEPFRHERDGYYADREVIDLILRCMLYKAHGSFYNASPRPEEAARTLLDAIRTLMQHPDYNITPADYYANPLVTLDVKKRTGIGSNTFPKTIINIQSQADPALRLAEASYYFERLVNALIFPSNSASVTQSQNHAPYLYELLPNRILPIVDTNGRHILTLGNPAYNKEDDHVAELAADRIEKLNRDPADPFVPSNLAFMRRAVQLTYLAHSSGIKGTQLNAEYRFLDASPFGDHLDIGDKLVLNLPTGQHIVGAITSAEKPKRSLSAVFATPPTGKTDLDWGKQIAGQTLKATENVDISVAYYANLQPAKYYLDMLALYLHQLFFAYSPLTVESRDKVDLQLIRERKVQANRIATPAIKRQAFWRRSQAPNLERIHRRIAHMYIKLTFHESCDSYYDVYDEHDTNSWRLVINKVAADTQVLCEEIGHVLTGDKHAFKFDPPTTGVKWLGQVAGEIKVANKKPFLIREFMRDLLVE